MNLLLNFLPFNELNRFVFSFCFKFILIVLMVLIEFIFDITSLKEFFNKNVPVLPMTNYL